MCSKMQWVLLTNNCMDYFVFVCTRSLLTKKFYLILVVMNLECFKWVTGCLRLLICIKHAQTISYKGFLHSRFLYSLSLLSVNIWRSLKMCSKILEQCQESLSYTVNTFYTEPDYTPLINQLYIHIPVLCCYTEKPCISRLLFHFVWLNICNLKYLCIKVLDIIIRPTRVFCKFWINLINK